MILNPRKKINCLSFLSPREKKKSHHQSLLADEQLILWGCQSDSHKPVKHTLAYFALLPSNLFVSIWSYRASIL